MKRHLFALLTAIAAAAGAGPSTAQLAGGGGISGGGISGGGISSGGVSSGGTYTGGGVYTGGIQAPQVQSPSIATPDLGTPRTFEQQATGAETVFEGRASSLRREMSELLASTGLNGQAISNLETFIETGRAAPEAFAAAAPLLKRTMVEALALRGAPGGGPKVQALSAAAYRKALRPANIRAVLAARGYSPDLEPHVLIPGVTQDGRLVIYIPRDENDLPNLDFANPIDWTKSVGPGAEDVPGYQEPITDATARPADYASKRAKSCGVGENPPCFHPAVAIHTDFGRVQCSGVQIADGWVLTAGHCVCSGLEQASVGAAAPGGGEDVGPISTTNLRALTVRFFGETSQTDKIGFCPLYAKMKAAPTREAKRKAAARLYAMKDLALVRLDTGLTLPAARTIASVQDPAGLFGLGHVQIAGFGTNNNQTDGGRKTFFTAPFAGSRCAQLSETELCLPEHEIALIGDEEGTDSCSGDSGAGAYVRLKDGGWSVVAITSRASGDRVCGSGGIYVRVAQQDVIDWIAKVVGEDLRIAAASEIQQEISEELSKWLEK